MNHDLAILGGASIRSKPWPSWPIYGPEEEQALLRTLNSGKWGKTEGDETTRFEKRFPEYCNVRHAIAVCNGTISLRIALLAAGIKAGDEVIIPPYTFIATATAVIEANAAPVFADIDRESLNIDPRAIERAITPRTRAIIPVHLGGLPCDMDAIMSIAKRHNLIVIEDAAHAHGSEYHGRRAGSLAHIASFSFQSSKNLTSGEGGIIVTDDDNLAAACRSIHNCGRAPGRPWYEHHVISGNYRLGEFQSAILNCQLDRLDEQTDRRDANGKYLDANLARIPGIAPQKRTADATRHAYHLYCFRYDQREFGFPRQRFIDAVAAEGVPVSSGYVLPLYKQPLFGERNFGPYTGCTDHYRDVSLDVCERICAGEGAWLTQDILLGSRQDMDDVVRAFQKVYDHRKALASAPAAAGASR